MYGKLIMAILLKTSIKLNPTMENNKKMSKCCLESTNVKDDLR